MKSVRDSVKFYMAEIRFFQSHSQIQSQKQVQKLSQRQIFSLKLLSLPGTKLAEEIFRTAEKNPALIVECLEKKSGGNSFSYDENNGKTNFSFSPDASDVYNSMLESAADNRETLSKHLTDQLHLLKLSENEIQTGELLISTLDKNGFLTMEPKNLVSTVLSKISERERHKILKKMIPLIQNFDPVGCCVKNSWESLFVQGKWILENEEISQKKENAETALFILDGHEDFLDPFDSDKILKKILNYFSELENLSFLRTKEKAELQFFASRKEFLTDENILDAMSFIRLLNPYPASDFSYSPNPIIVPDVRVEKMMTTGKTGEKNPVGKIENEFSADKNSSFDKNLISVKNDVTNSSGNFKITLEKEFNLSVAKNLGEGHEKEISDAQIFVDSINLRYSTLARASEIIVSRQKDFFEKGPGHLKPFLQKELAEILELSPSTVSRIATGKYLLCQWGIFDLGYFFSYKTKNSDLSQKEILFIIEEIIKNQKKGEKNLSDSKIVSILESRNVNISRRTVAKYRKMLDIPSSYER